MTFAEKIRAVREKMGITKRDIATRLGVSYTTYTKWEDGQRLPKRHILEKWAQLTQQDTNDYMAYYALQREQKKQKTKLFIDYSPKHKYENSTLGGRLRSKMNEAEISAHKLAEEIRVPKTSVISWLENKTRPHIIHIIRICNYLNTSTRYIENGLLVQGQHIRKIDL